MTRSRAVIVGVALVGLAILGWNPFAATRDTSGLVVDAYSAFETGVERQSNGVYRVRALTRMPKVKARMVRWWFADYLQTTAQYQRWHPTAHVWMDWENKVPGQVIGASHLVHEFIGPELQELRIQFVPPRELLGALDERWDGWVICARVGLLEQPVNLATMCHLVRDTEWGAEMRSVFWMGEVARRDGNHEVFSIEGLIGNTAIARVLAVDEQDAIDLMTHAIQEMGYLADFLPGLYAGEGGAAPPGLRERPPTP